MLESKPKAINKSVKNRLSNNLIIKCYARTGVLNNFIMLFFLFTGLPRRMKMLRIIRSLIQSLFFFNTLPVTWQICFLILAFKIGLWKSFLLAIIFIWSWSFISCWKIKTLQFFRISLKTIWWHLRKFDQYEGRGGPSS